MMSQGSIAKHLRCDESLYYTINQSAGERIFTARCYASAVLAMGLCLSVRLCPSVCPSQVGVLLKRLNVGSDKQHHTIPGILVFCCQRSPRNSTGVTPTRAPNAGGVVKIGDFRQITGYISKTVKDRHILSIKVE